MNYFIPFLIAIFLLGACNNASEDNNSDSSNTDNNGIKDQTVAGKTDKMLQIEEILIGDWIEDSIEFKKNYNMPPPPVQNTRVRYQKDGYVYIPDVLLTKENWDKWEVANDTTLLIHKRQNNGTLRFIIDDIQQNEIYYRLEWGQHFRKIKLIRIND